MVAPSGKPPLRLVTPPNRRANIPARTLIGLAQTLRAEYALLKSWRKTAEACDVLTDDGRPDPGLAQRIALHGYDPRRPETRARLGLPPICIACGQKVHRVRVVPEWVKQAAKNLRELEARAVHKNQIRVYSRSGKRVTP